MAVTGTIANLNVVIGATTKDFEAGMQRVSKTASGIGTGLLKVGGIAAIALGTGLVAATKAGVDGIVAMENQTAQLNAVLKSTNGAVGMSAKEISGMASALQLTTKFAEEDTLAAQNMLFQVLFNLVRH